MDSTTPDKVVMCLMADRPRVDCHYSHDGLQTTTIQYRIGHNDWMVVRTVREGQAYNSFARTFDGFDGARRYYERFV